MIDLEVYHMIRELKLKGMKVKGIINECGITLDDYRKYSRLREQEFMKIYNKFKENDIENYRNFVVSILSITPNISNTTVYQRAFEEFSDFNVKRTRFLNFIDRVRMETGYIKRYKRIKERHPDDIPGIEAQVDFGQYLIKDMYGKDIRIYFFCMILSYSRMLFAYFQREPFTSETAVLAHEYAFKFFGGRPQNILYDQDRVFVVSELFQDFTLTKIFKEYVEKTGFTVELCHKYNPDCKGKVENAVKNIKRKFLDGRVLNSIDSLNSKCIEWLDNIGNNIVNFTTKNTPKDMFIEERKYLQKVREYNINKPLVLTTDDLGSFEYKGNKYQLPKKYGITRMRVKLIERDKKLYVYREFFDEPIITFDVPDGIGKIVVDVKGSMSGQKIKELNKLFANNKYYIEFLNAIKKEDERFLNAQLERILNLSRYYEKEKIILAFKFCTYTKKYRVQEMIAFILVKYKDTISHNVFSNLSRKSYIHRMKEIKEILSYGRFK